MSYSKAHIVDLAQARGYVDWQLIDNTTGKIVDRGVGYTNQWYERVFDFLPHWVVSRLQSIFPLGTRNAVLDTARTNLANAFIGTAQTYPQFVAIGTGTNGVASSDTGLQTLVQYDGANNAKQASSRNLKGNFTSRIVTNFPTGEANQNIRELGLFEEAAATNIWARVNVTINKTSSQRLNIFWYILFERRTGLAIKTGISIAATGTLTNDTDSTLTFSSNVTVVVIENNNAGLTYVRINGAIVGDATPTVYDFIMQANSRKEFLAEEFDISTLHVVRKQAGNITLPNNEFSAVGW